MGEQDPSERLKGDHPKETKENGTGSFSQFSASVRTMVRIRQKYQALKKRRLEIAATSSHSFMSPRSTSPKIFTFENLQETINSNPSSPRKRKKKEEGAGFVSEQQFENRTHKREKPCKELPLLVVHYFISTSLQRHWELGRPCA